MMTTGRQLWDDQVYQKLVNKLRPSTLLALGRAYSSGYLVQPIEQEPDESLLAVWGIGPKRLAEIRRVIPAPRSILGKDGWKSIGSSSMGEDLCYCGHTYREHFHGHPYRHYCTKCSCGHFWAAPRLEENSHKEAVRGA